MLPICHLRGCAMMCLVPQLCLTLCDPMDCSPPGSSVHGDSLGKNTRVGCYALLQGIFPTQGPNPGLLHCRCILPSEPPGKPLKRLLWKERLDVFSDGVTSGSGLSTLATGRSVSMLARHSYKGNWRQMCPREKWKHRELTQSKPCWVPGTMPGARVINYSTLGIIHMSWALCQVLGQH